MKTILIIEDNLEIRENTTELLELEGFSVITAVNGEEGILAATANCPDCILCDILMPLVDGYEVLRQLKEHPSTAHIPFIYLTASCEKSEIKLAMDMGADGYVRKPFDVKELTEALESCLKKSAT
jgi:CheY-like chemotaxis protein